MKLRECQLRGEESLSIVRRGKWVWKQYKPLDPRGRWPSANAWREQLGARVAASQEIPHINPVRRWFIERGIVVTPWVAAVRETTGHDVAKLRAILPRWIGDVTARNVIVGADGPVLIDFCVNHA